MEPAPLLVVAATLIVISFFLLTPAFRRWLSRTYPSDPFHVFTEPGSLPLRRVHFQALVPVLRAGIEGQGQLSRYRIISVSEIRFVPRHQWGFQDRGEMWWPAHGLITVVAGGVDAAFVVPRSPRWVRPFEIVLGALFGFVLLPASLIWGRSSLQAQVEDVLQAIARDASHNEALQLTKPAQAMELRS